MTVMHAFLLTFFADYLFGILVITSAVLVLRLPRNRGEVILRGSLAGVIALLIDKSSGLVYFHERPFVAMGKEALALNPHNNSFPSDHALIVFAAAFVVWIATKNWKIGLSLVLGGVAVGWARVIALVHWPLDIVGSFVIAGLMVLIWFWVPLGGKTRRAAHQLDAFLDKKLPKWLTNR